MSTHSLHDYPRLNGDGHVQPAALTGKPPTADCVELSLLSLLGLAKGEALFTATEVLKFVGQSFGADAAVVWCPDSRHVALQMAHSWSNGSEPAERLLDGLSLLELWPLEGLPGKVWAEGRAHVLTELAEDKHSCRSMLLAKSGILSAFALPIKRGVETIYVLELFAPNRSVFPSITNSRVDSLGQILGHVRFEGRLTQKAPSAEIRPVAAY